MMMKQWIGSGAWMTSEPSWWTINTMGSYITALYCLWLVFKEELTHVLGTESLLSQSHASS